MDKEIRFTFINLISVYTDIMHSCVKAVCRTVYTQQIFAVDAKGHIFVMTDKFGFNTVHTIALQCFGKIFIYHF